MLNLQSPIFTTRLSFGYTLATGAKSSVGTRTPELRKAYSRFNETMSFYVSVTKVYIKILSFWALYGTEAEQSVEGRHLCGTGQPVDGCENPVQCPPLSILTDVLGNNKSNTKVLVMSQNNNVTPVTPEQCFVPNKTINANIEPLYALVKRLESNLLLLQSDGINSVGFSVPHASVMYSLDSASADISRLLDVLQMVEKGGAA